MVLIIAFCDCRIFVYQSYHSVALLVVQKSVRRHCYVQYRSSICSAYLESAAQIFAQLTNPIVSQPLSGDEELDLFWA